MDPIVAALKNAENSAQLKAAAEIITCDRKYFTTEILNAILQKQNLIVDVPSANAVVSFLREFSRSANFKLLRTAEIRDLIIDVLASKISSGHPVEMLGLTICGMVFMNPRAAELYSSRKSFSTILDCFHRATTAESVREIAMSINDICYYNSGVNKILNDLPVVEAYSAIIPRATTDASVWAISHSIQTLLKNNEPIRNDFGTVAFLERFRSIEKYANAPYADSSFKHVRELLFSTVVCAAN